MVGGGPGVRGLRREARQPADAASRPAPWRREAERDRAIPSGRPETMATAEVPLPRILVVDDEPNIADLLSVALRFEGYDVMASGTGTEAWNWPARTGRISSCST